MNKLERYSWSKFRLKNPGRLIDLYYDLEGVLTTTFPAALFCFQQKVPNMNPKHEIQGHHNCNHLSSLTLR